MPVAAGTFRPVYLPEARERERERGSASARGYDRAWQRVRAAHVAREPLCRFCAAVGRVTAVAEVDHIVPIRVDPGRRLDPTNLRSLCKTCHSTHTASGA